MIIANWKCNGSTEMILSWFEAYNIEFDFENYDFDIFIGLALPSIYLNYFDRDWVKVTNAHRQKSETILHNY